jgi:glucosamine--fructose-6-phosphate aminotransferase (isomerizing)
MSVTYDEILHQPDSWQETLNRMPGIWENIAPHLDTSSVTHALFIGCGTSLYIAQTAAHTFTELTGITAAAVPASEVFLSSASILPGAGSIVAFIISRSGTTSEGLLAADYLRSLGNRATTIAITCHDDTPLAAKCDAAIELPFAAETSVVMTQSFTTMLLALQMVAASWAANQAMLDALRELPAAFHHHLPDFERFAETYGDTTAFASTIFLGLGPNQGLAEEGTLKLKEMTQQHCEAYNPLEFRHGPISIVDQESLVILIEGNRESRYIEDVERDIQRYGAQVVRLAPYDSGVIQEGLILGENLGDLARCCLYLPPLQLLAVCRAQSSGLDPDRPRNLNQVVVLNER